MRNASLSGLKQLDTIEVLLLPRDLFRTEIDENVYAVACHWQIRDGSSRVE